MRIVSFRWYVFSLLIVLVNFQYLPSDWLERLLSGSLTVASLQKAQAGKSAYDFLGIYSIVPLFSCMVVLLRCYM